MRPCRLTGLYQSLDQIRLRVGELDSRTAQQSQSLDGIVDCPANLPYGAYEIDTEACRQIGGNLDRALKRVATDLPEGQ